MRLKEKNVVRFENDIQAREFMTVLLRYFEDNPKERNIKIPRKNLLKMINKYEKKNKEVIFV